mgnify:CR=1 FL=1
MASACSGKHRSERGGERDLRRSEVEDGDRAVLRCVPACLTWRRGRGRCGGAPGLVGEARGRRWTRQRRAAAMAPLGFGRESERERGRERARASRGSRGSVASQRESRATRGQPGRQLPAWHAAAPWLSSPLPSGRRKKTPLPSVGRPGGWAARWLGLAQGRPRFVSFSLSFI